MKAPPSLIVFDMDGVLIDVSRSYRDVVRQTSRRFFDGATSAEELPEPLFSLSELAAVKQSGGLNNDWELTRLVLSLLISRVKLPVFKHHSDPWSQYREHIGRMDVLELGQHLKTSSRPLLQLLEEVGKTPHPFVDHFYRKDIGQGNIIKQMFQEIYLGSDRFETTYPVPVEMRRNSGYITRETLLIDRSTLEELSKQHTLAIATGRPRAEADYPLDHFGLRPYFSVVLTLDDCVREERRRQNAAGDPPVSLSKPHPYMLEAAFARAGGKKQRSYYIGDMPDDMIAASRANPPYRGIGLLLSAPDKAGLRQDLLRAGADYIIDGFDEVNALLAAD
ncbi:MAG: HAD hydrolase-like protein [Desulfobacterales bacterium]